MKEKKLKITNLVLDGILVIVILFTIAVSVTAYVSRAGSGVPSFLGIRPFAVQTESMRPEFQAGDLIIDTAVKDPTGLQVGDVITFWTVINSRRVLNTHRIEQIKDYGNFLAFITKGDGNPQPDETEVHQSDIVGLYQFRIPLLGKLVDLLKTGKGFFVCIVIPVFVFFLYNFYHLIKAWMEYNEAKRRPAQEGEDERLIELARKLLEEERKAEREAAVPNTGADTSDKQ